MLCFWVAGVHDTSATGRGGQESPQSGPTASAPINLAEPRPRKTQVLLPAETDAQARNFLPNQNTLQNTGLYKSRQSQAHMVSTRQCSAAAI